MCQQSLPRTAGSLHGGIEPRSGHKPEFPKSDLETLGVMWVTLSNLAGKGGNRSPSTQNMSIDITHAVWSDNAMVSGQKRQRPWRGQTGRGRLDRPWTKFLTQVQLEPREYCDM